MKTMSRGNWYVATAWLIVLGGYIAVCEWVPAGAARISAANILLCLMPLLVNGALLVNAVTPETRRKVFWMLLALGCTFWMAAQAVWTYVEVYQHRHIPYLFFGDIVFFLHAIPMIAALAVQPHKNADDRKMVFGYVDFSLIVCWWMYLYAFVVIPWQYVVADDKNYIRAFSVVSSRELHLRGRGDFALFSNHGVLAPDLCESRGRQGYLRVPISGGGTGDQPQQLYAR